MDKTAKPGAMLKALRLQKGWKLAEVSKRTGFTISALSKIENDKIALTYDKLARISRGLDVDIGVFFGRDDLPNAVALTTGRRSIIRAGEGRIIETQAYGHEYMASELLNKRFVPVVAEIHARSLEAFGEMIRHPGEEYAFVLEGIVELHTDIYAPVQLKTGDSIYFDSGMAHAYIAVGETPCRILSICSGDESQLITAYEKDPPVASKPAPPEPSASSRPTRRRRVAAA